MATHSGILAWRIPWTEEPGSLYTPWGHKELDTAERLTPSLSDVGNPPLHLGAPVEPVFWRQGLCLPPPRPACRRIKRVSACSPGSLSQPSSLSRTPTQLPCGFPGRFRAPRHSFQALSSVRSQRVWYPSLRCPSPSSSADDKLPLGDPAPVSV